MESQSEDKPSKMDFLISFLVDARGGSMTGSRKSGIRMVIPPQSAEQPVRITCRQLRPDQVLTLPPLSEGEGLACRILKLTPATFLAPVLMEVPYFTPLSDNREIIVLRSETGKKWTVHLNTTENSNLTSFMATSINNIMDNINTTTITAIKIPQYFAIISRPRQETISVGPNGGVVDSKLNHQVQCLFPSRSLTKQISVGISVFSIHKCFTKEMTQQAGAVSPVITIEPRRRKFHKAITVTIPVPEVKLPTMTSRVERNPQPGHLLQMREDMPIETELMLLCSMSGSGSRTVWEDVTLSTPLSFSNNCVQFTTVVSAQFWLLKLPAWMASDKLAIADRIYRSAMRVPYLAQLWLFWREAERKEVVELRVVMVTEGERVTENTLEEKESFTLLGKSAELDILDKSEIQLKISGNIETISGSVQKINFRPFMENRTTVEIKRKEAYAPAAGQVEVVTDCEEVLFTMPLLFQMGEKEAYIA